MTIEQLSAIHKEMLDGADWQTAAVNNGIIDSYEFSNPSPDCSCEACQKATTANDWWD